MKPFWTTKKTLTLCAMFGLWSLLTIPALGQASDWKFENFEDGTAAAWYEGVAFDALITVPSTSDIGNTVTCVKEGAFSNKVSLVGIAIPNTVTNIDDNAFYGCVQLSELLFNEFDETHRLRIGKQAFYGCTSLSAVVLPPGLEIIDDSAFEDCQGLSLQKQKIDILIPDYVTYIGVGAFSNCVSLQGKLVLPPNLPVLGAKAFENCTGITVLEINKTLTQIGDRAFKDCGSIDHVTGGEGLVEIGASAFQGCSSLRYWPDPPPPRTTLNLRLSAPNLENIGDSAFKSCTAFEEVLIGNAVTNIGEDAFAFCSGLWTIALGQRLVTIGAGAFRATALKRLDVPNTVTYMGNAVCSNCASLTGVHLSNTLQYLGTNGFYSCDTLMYIDIPDSLQSIEFQTFEGCTGLLDVNIGNGITYIGEEAFRTCSALTNMVIGGKVRTVDRRAFFECIRLRDIFLGKTVDTIGIQAFAFCPELMNITVTNTNPNFMSREGVLFDRKAPTTLVTMPGGRKGEYSVPNDVSYIGPYAFSHCSLLTAVKFPNERNLLKGIKDGAFYRCIGLLRMDVPDSVTVIGRDAFRYCTKLEHVSTGNGVTELDQELFSGCVALADAVVGNSVVYIGTNCFNHCIELSNLTLPDGLQEIDDRGFYDCMNLTSFRIPPAVERLGAYSLGHCYGLTTVTIPASVKEVGDYAFYQCRKMQSIYFEGNAPTTETYSFVLQDAVCVAYVRPGSTGWGVDIPGTWGYIPIEYYGDLMGEGTASVAGIMVTEDSTNAVPLSKDATYYLDMLPVPLNSEGLIDLGEVADPERGRDGSIRLSHLISVAEAGEGAQLPGVAEVTGADGKTVPAEVVFTPTSGGVEILTTKDGQLEEGVTVWIDNAVEPVGVTPLTVSNLAASTHILLLQKAGFLRPRPVMFTVTADSVLSIEIPLTEDDEPAMEMNVQSTMPDVNIYVDFLPTGKTTPQVIGGMDPGIYSGEGWSSTAHSILLRHELLTPYAPRMVPEWETDPETGDPIIPEDPESVTIAAPNDFLDSDGDGMTNIYEVELGLDPFVSNDNVLSAKATNGETVTIQAQKEAKGVVFSTLSSTEQPFAFQSYVLGEVTGAEGSVVKSGLYLVMKLALAGEESDKVFAHPCVVEVFNSFAVLVTWDIPDTEGTFFVLGLCDEAEAKELGRLSDE